MWLKYVKLLGGFLLCSSIMGQDFTTLKSGDLLFIEMNCGPLCEAIHAVTSGINNKNISHLGLVEIKNDSIMVIEAAGTEVRKVSLEAFIKNASSEVIVARVKPKYKKRITDVLAFANSKIGMPYDDEFLLNNQKYYCSELIYEAFEFAYQKPFFQLAPMTFKQPNSDDFFPVWVDYYKALNTEIPEGALGCNPAEFSKSKKLKIIASILID